MEYAVEIIYLIKNTGWSFLTQLGLLVFQKTETYCNKTFNIHAHIYYKCDNKKRKKVVGIFTIHTSNMHWMFHISDGDYYFMLYH